MTLSVAPPSRRRFGGLRRMFRSAHSKGSVSAASTDEQLQKDTQQAPSAAAPVAPTCEDPLQKPAPAVQLQIHAAADVATPAAAQWQLRDNSIYSPAVQPRSVKLCFLFCETMLFTTSCGRIRCSTSAHVQQLVSITATWTFPALQSFTIFRPCVPSPTPSSSLLTGRQRAGAAAGRCPAGRGRCRWRTCRSIHKW